MLLSLSRLIVVVVGGVATMSGSAVAPAAVDEPWSLSHDASSREARTRFEVRHTRGQRQGHGSSLAQGNSTIVRESESETVNQDKLRATLANTNDVVATVTDNRGGTDRVMRLRANAELSPFATLVFGANRREPVRSAEQTETERLNKNTNRVTVLTFLPPPDAAGSRDNNRERFRVAHSRSDR
ncbi:hypothetical protein JCM3766R1_005668 [Sporobolomyces carnicolor]